MKNDYNNESNPVTAVHLHLELKHDYLDDSEKMILHRYGETSTNDSISRDILPEDIYSRLTCNTVKGWTDLVGILFQPPIESEQDVFWDDDYHSGSIKTWLKKKYTGPYIYRGQMEHYEYAQNDIKELIEHFPMMDVRESFKDLMKNNKKIGNTKARIIKKAPLIELTLAEMNNSIALEGGTESLLERLEVAKVIAFMDEAICTKNIFPVTHKLIYNYDFGDNWTVTITKNKDAKELIEKCLISKDELLEAESTILTNHKPVCINKDGVFVLDDVGGLCGFINFLKEIYEGEDKEERNNYLTWAQSLGWSSRKISNKLIL